MIDMDTSAINWNNITLATAALIAVGVVWRAYVASVNDHIKDLREFQQNLVFDLRARVMVLEDKAGIQHADGFKYTPHANPRELKAAANLDS